MGILCFIKVNTSEENIFLTFRRYLLQVSARRLALLSQTSMIYSSFEGKLLDSVAVHYRSVYFTLDINWSHVLSFRQLLKLTSFNTDFFLQFCLKGTTHTCLEHLQPTSG
jgi:hypothetical protein